MAIQMRRGVFADFDTGKMIPGEFAVVLSGDATTSTGKGVYICFAAGDVQRLSTYEEIAASIQQALEDDEQLQQYVISAVEDTLEDHPEWTTTVQDGAVTVAKLNSNVTAFTEASSRTNIASGDGITTIWGKIKKFFTDLKAVAFSGAYTDVSGLTDNTANLKVNSVEAGLNIGAKNPTNNVNILLNTNSYGNHGLVSQGYYPGDAASTEYVSDFKWLLYRDETGHVTIPRNLTVSNLITSGYMKKTTGGDVVIGEASSATNLQYRLKNSVKNLSIHLNSGGEFGFYDDTNATWAIKFTVGDIPWLRCASGSASTPLVSISNDSGKTMAGLSCNSTTQVRFYGQFGGTSYSNMYATVSSSDPRLKENIRDAVIEALPIINQIQMHSFDWKNDGKHWDVGFIAPELYEIDPNLAIKPSDEEEGDSYWGVHDFYLVGMLTKAVQELSAENTELKERLSRLEERVARLEG